MSDPIQSLCEQGQRALLATDYLAAERFLVAAETLAWKADDLDALARLYMPLQEARRQRRQLSNDGAFATIYAKSADEILSAVDIAARHPAGQLIVAGFGTIAPAMTLRAIASQRGLFLDLPLVAAYAVDGQITLLFVPTPDGPLPAPASVDSLDTLLKLAPRNSLAVAADALPPDQAKGDSHTFGTMMTLWENLHAPFLKAADAETDPRTKLRRYRETIRADYACEFAHQRLSKTAHDLGRHK